MREPMKNKPHRTADRFPPEASVDYSEVRVEQVDALRNELARRFGIGTGRLRVQCEPTPDVQTS